MRLCKNNFENYFMRLCKFTKSDNYFDDFCKNNFGNYFMRLCKNNFNNYKIL